MADKIIKICDRCKKEYPKDKNSILSFEIKELSFKIDFCPICAETFLAWAIPSEEKGENNEK